MEAKGAEFHRKVRQGYLEQARQDPGRYAVVDASRTADEVWVGVQRVMAEKARTLTPRGRIA
jgi:dTMP kinase